MAKNAEEIRESVRDSYGRRVEGLLAADELIPLTVVGSSGASCDAGACCSTDDEDALIRIADLYSKTDIADLPATVTDAAFGCGNPTGIATLRPGETVLDLGSGGGIDCFLAAKMVGEAGKVYGVDMTPNMIELARRNAEKVGARNVEFQQSTIESLPLAEGAVDVIISNCVINLSPDKDAVFREAFRVLRPGGRLQVSDIVWTREPSQEVRDDMERWASCIGGALLESDYLGKIARAGFVDVRSALSEYEGSDGLASANVVAIKPGG